MAGIYRYPWTFLHLNASPKGVHIEGYSLNTELRSIKRGTGTWKFPRRENNADTTTGEAILQSKVRWVLSWSGIVLIAWYAAFYAFLPLHRFSTSYTSHIFVLSTPSRSVFISLLCFVALWSNVRPYGVYIYIYIYTLQKRNIFTCHTTVYWHLGVYTLRDTGEWKGLSSSSMLCEKFSRKRDVMVQWDAIASKEELIDSHCSRCRHWHFNKSADL